MGNIVGVLMLAFASRLQKWVHCGSKNNCLLNLFCYIFCSISWVILKFFVYKILTCSQLQSMLVQINTIHFFLKSLHTNLSHFMSVLWRGLFKHVFDWHINVNIWHRVVKYHCTVIYVMHQQSVPHPQCSESFVYDTLNKWMIQ